MPELVMLPTLGFLFIVFLFCLVLSFMPHPHDNNEED
jgi:hypothetical protein